MQHNSQATLLTINEKLSHQLFFIALKSTKKTAALAVAFLGDYEKESLLGLFIV